MRPGRSATRPTRQLNYWCSPTARGRRSLELRSWVNELSYAIFFLTTSLGQRVVGFGGGGGFGGRDSTSCDPRGC